jgi:ParB-like chromosome segregation protein Spo0J
MLLSTIKLNPANPRMIKDDKFKKLCKSVAEFPQMMELRPIIIDAENVILGGNMRFRALKENGMKEVPDSWVMRADDLTEKQKKEFVIKDNVGFGEWDWDDIANEWGDLPLDDWGLDIHDMRVNR